MFPSPTKANRHKSSVGEIGESIPQNNFKKETFNISSALYKQNGLKSSSNWPARNNSSIPYLIMIRVSQPNEIYNPYITFKNYKLALNEKWQSN
jgi:hypothetical protein